MLRLVRTRRPGHDHARRRPRAAQNATFYTVTYIEVGPAWPAQPRPRAAGLSRRRPQGQGDVRLEVFQRIDRPNQFVVLGAWTDQKALRGSCRGRARQDAERKARDRCWPRRSTPASTTRLVGRAGQDRAAATDHRGHPRRRHPAAEGQRRRRAQAARRRQPQARRQPALRRLAADQPAQPFHRGRSLDQPRRLRRSIRCSRRPASSAASSPPCPARSTTSGSTARWSRVRPKMKSRFVQGIVVGAVRTLGSAYLHDIGVLRATDKVAAALGQLGYAARPRRPLWAHPCAAAGIPRYRTRARRSLIGEPRFAAVAVVARLRHWP